MQICPNCGEENPPRFRLCGFCGTALVAAGAAPATREIRKTVTIVFSDLKGSTDLGERLDSESLREVMNRYFEAMRAELEGHGGTIEKFIGDAIMAVFGLPTLHEDDALRAVRAASGMQAALVRLNDELDGTWGIRLANRTGVYTGEVVAGDPTGGQRLVTGDPVNTAARLEQAAPANEILIGELTHRLVREAVEVEPVAPLELKGKVERVPAYRLIAVRDEAVRGRDAAAVEASPMIGRAREIGRLREAFAVAVEERSLRTVTVVGDAGVGKSRLTREFLASLDEEAYVVRGRCLAYGRGITFWPVAEIVRSAAEIDDDDPPERAQAKLRGLVGDEDVAQRLASVTGLSDSSFPLAETFWAVQRLVEMLSDRGPLVVVVDDIHWAEPTLLDLIEHLSEADLVVPVLVLCAARHDLLEERPDVGGASARGADRARSAGRGAGRGDGERAGRAVRAHSGDPRARDRRRGRQSAVRRAARLDADRRGDDRAPPAPRSRRPASRPTIEALVAARLDRLGHDERAVVDAASVVGLAVPRTGGALSRPGDGQRGAGHAPRCPRSQAVRPPLGFGRRRRSAFPLPSHPDPRRGLQRPAQADAGGDPRALRRMGRRRERRAAARARVRRDPWLSPGAGVSISWASSDRSTSTGGSSEVEPPNGWRRRVGVHSPVATCLRRPICCTAQRSPCRRERRPALCS